jgi:hypothetical protein
MTAPDKRERRFQTLAVVLCVVLVILPVLYLLAAGPIMVLGKMRIINDTLISWYFAPMFYVCQHNQWCDRICGSYLTLWGKK